MRLERDGAFRGGPRLRKNFAGGQHVEHAQHGPCNGQARYRQGKLRIASLRGFVELDRTAQSLRIALAPVILALKVELPRLDVVRVPE